MPRKAKASVKVQPRLEEHNARDNERSYQIHPYGAGPCGCRQLRKPEITRKDGSRDVFDSMAFYHFVEQDGNLKVDKCWIKENS